MQEDEALQSLDAVKNGRVYPIMLSEMYASATRTQDGVETFAKGLYPDVAIDQLDRGMDIFEETTVKKEKVVRTSMYAAVLIFLILFLVFSVLAAVTFGNADLSLKDVYSVILYKLFHIRSLGAYGEGAIHDVVWLIRLPRVLLALAIGMALSVCGVVMQAIVQNPLADPYVLGISSGASLGATLAIMLGIGSFLGGNSVGICAFMGAMLTSFAVIAIANMGGKATSAKLILARNGY